jgi:hypothetical protein
MRAPSIRLTVRIAWRYPQVLPPRPNTIPRSSLSHRLSSFHSTMYRLRVSPRARLISRAVLPPSETHIR